MSRGTGNPKKHVPVAISADTTGLSESDATAFDYLVEAVRGMDALYLDQMGQDLAATGGVFDESRPSRNYPPDLGLDEFEAYLIQYPDERDRLMSPFTVVVRDGGRLHAVPYVEYWRDACAETARWLEMAASCVESEGFATFLRAKAGSFRANDFKASDRLWVQTTGGPFELIIGPFESYTDKLRGVKRAFQGFLGIVAEKENDEVQQYRALAREYDALLGERFGYAPATMLTPLTVVDAALSTGDAVYGGIFIASNLPNDPDIHDAVGSKKTFVRNIMLSKYGLMREPILNLVLDQETAQTVSFENHLRFVVGHEISHGFSFRFGGEDFVEIASMLEELKADVSGLGFIGFLVDDGILPGAALADAIMGRLADTVGKIGVGMGQAHAAGSVIQYNWLAHEGAVAFDGERLVFQPELFRGAYEALLGAIYQLADSRDYAMAQAFVEEWCHIPEDLELAGQLVTDVPQDIDPVFTN